METFSAYCLLWGESICDFPLKRPMTQSFEVYLICAWTNGWTKNRDSGHLRRYRAYYGVTVMYFTAFSLSTRKASLKIRANMFHDSAKHIVWNILWIGKNMTQTDPALAPSSYLVMWVTCSFGEIHTDDIGKRWVNGQGSTWYVFQINVKFIAHHTVCVLQTH